MKLSLSIAFRYLFVLIFLVCTASRCDKSDYLVKDASSVDMYGQHFYGDQGRSGMNLGYFRLEQHNDMNSTLIIIVTPWMYSTSSKQSVRFFIHIIEPSLISKPIIGKQYDFKKGVQFSYCDSNGRYWDTQFSNSLDNTLVEQSWFSSRNGLTIIDGGCEFDENLRNSGGQPKTFFTCYFWATFEDDRGEIEHIQNGIFYTDRIL